MIIQVGALDILIIQRRLISMKTLSLTKEELCLISIALNEYQMELDNYHLDEMRQVSTKIDTIYKEEK